MTTLSDIVKEGIPFFGNGQINKLDETQFSANDFSQKVVDVFNNILAEDDLDLSLNSLSEVFENSGKTPVIYTRNSISIIYEQTLLSLDNIDIPLGIMFNGVFNKMLHDSNPEAIKKIIGQFYWMYHSNSHNRSVEFQDELFDFSFSLFRFREEVNYEDIFKKFGFSINKYLEKRKEYEKYLIEFFYNHLPEAGKEIEKKIFQSIPEEFYNTLLKKYEPSKSLFEKSYLRLYYQHNFLNHIKSYWDYFCPRYIKT